MPDIKQLPPSVVNKIAAGEVIERPASVVKELLENSVDAGAKRIDISVEAGGSELVRVADNGCGIDAEQLSLAVASHATSKIRDADDLFHVGSLGFRGEALASIAEISHFKIRSRRGDDAAGAELEVVGGSLGPIAPCGCPVGTTIEVRNLFFNTPVRRKFLRTTQTEMGHALEAFTRIALAYPDVHFTFNHNGRPVHELPPVSDWRERIAALFGDELTQSLIAIESSDGDVTLRGLVADPTHSRGSNRMQYVFLNGRHIRDRALQHALGEAYRGLLMTGRFPIAFLRLDMPAHLVDVNVHPTKLEVRFQDGSRLYSILLGSLRRKFLTTDLTARVGAAQEAAAGAPVDDAHDPVRAEQHRREVADWARGQIPTTPDPDVSQQVRLALQYESGARGIPPFKPFDDGRSALGGMPTSSPAERIHTSQAAGLPPADVNGFTPAPATLTDAEAQPATIGGPPISSQPHPSPAGPFPGLGIQLHNRYLITENEDGILVVDQHALHERVLYEQLRNKVLESEIETQRLLVPEPVTLLPSEAAAVLDARDTLARLGIGVEPFGGDTVLVTSYPAMLANFNPAETLRQVVEHLLGDGKSVDARDLLDELLHMMSCKAAIKAGDRLAPEEVSALLEQRHLFHDTHHCPHGRPTALLFTKDELDKRFKRI